MDEQQAPPATGSPFSSTSSWHSAFDPPSETLSPKHDKKRPKDVASKKSKKKNKKSEKTSTTLRQSQVQAQPSAGNSAVPMESPVPARQDSRIQFLIFFVKTKKKSLGHPRTKHILLDITVVGLPK